MPNTADLDRSAGRKALRAGWLLPASLVRVVLTENDNPMDERTYKRCEFIIRQFMSEEKPTAELAARFHGWLLDGRHCREKNVIIRKVFFEALSDAVVPAYPYPNDIPASENELLEKLLVVKKM